MKTGDLNQMPSQSMKIMQNNWLGCPQTCQIIKAVSFITVYSSKTCKISCVTTQIYCYWSVTLICCFTLTLFCLKYESINEKIPLRVLSLLHKAHPWWVLKRNTCKETTHLFLFTIYPLKHHCTMYCISVL